MDDGSRPAPAGVAVAAAAVHLARAHRVLLAAEPDPATSAELARGMVAVLRWVAAVGFMLSEDHPTGSTAYGAWFEVAAKAAEAGQQLEQLP